VIVSSVLGSALCGSGTEVPGPFSGIGEKNFRRIWSRACACGSGKAWNRGLGSSAPLTMVFSVLDSRSARGEIESLMNYFAVSKGDTDVRVVYDGTLSVLNASLWAPYFPLPTLQSHLRIVEPGTYMADNGVGECFHNWILDERVRKWCGIDLTSILRSETRVWERWERCAMGLRPSPYVSVRGVL